MGVLCQVCGAALPMSTIGLLADELERALASRRIFAAWTVVGHMRGLCWGCYSSRSSVREVIARDEVRS